MYFNDFSFFSFLLCHSNYKNITRIAHSYRKYITRNSTLEYKLDYMTKTRTPTTGTKEDNRKSAVMVRRDYDAQGSREVFLSFESNDDDREILYGFLRLRLPEHPLEQENLFPELQGRCAFIRELHVYGAVTAVSDRTRDQSSQHVGFGRRLMYEAERVARDAKYHRIAVIAGIGTREYYRKKCGYELRGTYMLKELGHHDRSFLRVVVMGSVVGFLLGWLVCGTILTMLLLDGFVA